jgi:penicillin-binding protein 1A
MEPRGQTQAPRRHPARVYALVASLGVFLLLALLWQRCGVSGCPNVARLTSYQPGGASVLLDASGEPFAELTPVAHEVVSLATLPEHVPAAFLAVEDQRFYRHNGIDYRRVGGALLADIRAGGFVEGFSTITMQLARNVWPEQLPGSRRTLRRKVLEIRVALDIERHFSKDDILELYLNHIYFGGGAYGIAAASRHYFRKPVTELTLHEAAVLAALPKSPTLYNPRRFPERARERRDLVLTLMAEQELASADDVERARSAELGVSREAPRRRENAGSEGPAPYFVEAVRRVLEARFGEGVYTQPLRVRTTIDLEAQQIAERQLERQLRLLERGVFGRYTAPRYSPTTPPDGAPEYVQGAVVMMEAATGDVRALVGGRDFRQSRFDRATQARRQVGSAFKPFVFAAALAEGYAPSQLVSDSVLRMELAGGEVWEPRNFEGEFEGHVTVRDALVRSKNVPTIRLAADVGLSDVTRLARRAGIRSDMPHVPSVAIGTAALTPLELTAAYTSFATLGTAVQPRMITRVERADGRVLWDNAVRTRQVTDSAVAYLITNMLQEAVDSGTATQVRQAGYTRTAAGKTGTTNDGADAWYVGYTPSHVTTVWIGFDRPAPLGREATGGRVAAPVWARLMRDYDRRAPDGASAWGVPSTVVEAAVDPATGLVLRDGCRPHEGAAGTELFVKGREPARVCPEGEAVVSQRGVLARTGSWIGRQWRRMGRWVTRHFGTEEPQPMPRDGDFLGAPRLPQAVEVMEPEVDAEEFRVPAVPLGVPVTIDTARRPVIGDTILMLSPGDSGLTLRPVVVPDTVPPPDTTAPPR